MNCRRVSNLVSAYMDGELTGVEMLEIRRHLDDCRACNLQYEELRMAKQLLARLPVAQPRPGLADSICARIDCVRVPRYQRLLNRVSSYGRKRFTPVAAGCVGIGAVMMFLAAQSPQSTSLLASRPSSHVATFARSISSEPVEASMPDLSNLAPRPHRSRLYIPNDEPSGAPVFTLTSYPGP